MKKINSLSLIRAMLLAALTLTTGCQIAKIGSVPEKWHFVVVGDSRGDDVGVNTKILSELTAQIVSNNPDFVLFTGDLVTGSKDSQELRAQLTKWRDIMQPVYDAKIKVYNVRGNHDTGSRENSLGLNVWNKIFVGQYAMPGNGPSGGKNVTYSVTHNNALIIAVDQYSTEGRNNDQEWLDSQLAGNSVRHIFVMGHKPAFAVNHQDCLDDYPEQRNEFLDSITKAGGRTYFCGHDHFYDHISADHDNDPSNDIHQFIVGTAGAPLYQNKGQYTGDNAPYQITPIAGAGKYGYLVVSVECDVVTTTWFEQVAENDYQPQDTWTYTVSE